MRRTLITFMLVLVPAIVSAQSLQQALDDFRAARFEEAEQGLESVLASLSVSAATRVDALQVLTRTRYALGNRDGARLAIESMIDLEPPIVELDPETVAPPVMKLYYEARKVRSNSYALEAAPAGYRTVAVADFTNNAIGPNASDYERLGVGIAQAMSIQLGGLEDTKVVERLRIQWILDELELQRQSDIVDQESTVEAGKLLGVQYVFFGSFMVNKNRLLMNCRLVKVETGEILFGEQVTGKVNDYLDLMSKLTERVAETLGSRLEERPSPVDASFEALMAYSEGLQMLDLERYQAAYDAFRRAEVLGHTEAGTRAESLREVI